MTELSKKHHATLEEKTAWYEEHKQANYRASLALEFGDSLTEQVNLFENDIDEEVYTHRKTSYKMGRKDYPVFNPNPNWDEERRIQYRNGWSYAEWLNEL